MLLEYGVIEFDLEIDLEAVVGIEARPLVTVITCRLSRMRVNRLGAFCSSMPADCSRKTKGPRCRP